MSCSHPNKYVCQTCKPELWSPTKAWVKKWHIDHWTDRIKLMLYARKCYYFPESTGEDSPLTDAKYDSHENVIKELFPDHPILKMVGWNDGIYEECCEYINKNADLVLGHLWKDID